MLKEILTENPTEEEKQKILTEFALIAVNKNRVGNKLADLFAEVNREDKMVTDITVNCEDFWIIKRNLKEQFDPATSTEEIRKNNFGNLWGAKVHIKKISGIELINEDGKIFKF